MSFSRTLPSVLVDPRGSISMERALKQIHDLLLIGTWAEGCEDKVSASLDDLETMLSHIDFGD